MSNSAQLPHSNSESPAIVEIKCKMCDHWYEMEVGDSAKCPKCQFPARARIKQDPPLPSEESIFSLDLNKSLLPIKQGDHFIVYAFKKFVNFIFLVYLLFMAGLSWMAVTFSG